jgi:hypothetical protein
MLWKAAASRARFIQGRLCAAGSLTKNVQIDVKNHFLNFEKNSYFIKISFLIFYTFILKKPK